MIIRRIALPEDSSGWPDPADRPHPAWRRQANERSGPIQHLERDDRLTSLGGGRLSERPLPLLGRDDFDPASRSLWQEPPSRPLSGKLIVMLLYAFCLLTMMLFTLLT